MSPKLGKFGRSKTNRLVMGLCGGIADCTGIRTSIIRIAFVLLFLFTRGYALWGYLLASVFIPVAAIPRETHPEGEAQSADDWKRQWQRQREEGTPEGEIIPVDDEDA